METNKTDTDDLDNRVEVLTDLLVRTLDAVISGLNTPSEVEHSVRRLRELREEVASLRKLDREAKAFERWWNS